MKHLFITLALAVATLTAVANPANNQAAPAETNNAAAPALQTTHTYHVTITDAHTNEALAGAAIDINGKKYYTDFNGRIAINTQSTTQATISLISYRDITISLAPNTPHNINLQMQQL